MIGGACRGTLLIPKGGTIVLTARFMGIKNSTNDVARLSQEVDRIRHCIDEVMADLAKVKERIPGPREIIRQFSPAPEEHRRDLFYSCTSLELALEDTRRWAHDVADKAQR